MTPASPLAALSLSVLLSSLGISIANVALPTLAQSFGAAFQDVQWVVLAYMLATTIAVVGVGRLGDLIGRRRLLLGGIGLFAIASLACGLAPTLPLLIAARAAQGLGAAIMLSLAMALVGENVPATRTGSAMGLLGTMSAVGTALGPSLGGLLIGWFGWSAIFLVMAPAAVVTFGLATLSLKPAVTSATRSRFDLAGTALLALTLGAYALSMTFGRGSYGLLNGLLLLAAVTGLGLFLLVESRVAAPLLRPSMFRNRALSAGFATSALVSTVMMTTLVVGPFYLSRALGLDPLGVGLVMSAGPLVSAFTGMPAGRLVDRFGAGRITFAGLSGILLGAILLALMPAAAGIPGYVLPLVLTTASYASFQAANNTAVMTAIAATERGLVSGMLNLSRNLGLITGASAMGAIFALGAASPDIALATPDAAATGMRLAFAVAAALMLLALALVVAKPRSIQP